MTRGDYLIFFIETLLGTAVFCGLLTAPGWGAAEKSFLGAAFIAVMFAIEHRGMWADEQHRLTLQVLESGFSTKKQSFPEEFSTIVKRTHFERETALVAVSVFFLVGRYVVWFLLAWAIHEFVARHF